MKTPNTIYKNTEIGRIPVDWEVKTLNSLTGFITKGSTPTTYGFSWQQSGILFLRSECVSERGLDLSKSMFISEIAHKVLSRSEIKSNDILITITGNVGRVVYLEDDFGIGNINQHIGKIRIVKDEVDKYYIYHFLAQPPFQKYFNSIVTGQAYPQISLKQVREAPISLPPTKVEQTAIANALSDADALINNLEKLITKKRNIKQGAMQKLLQPKEDWEVKKLGEVVKSISSGKSNTQNSDGGNPIYGSTGIIGWKAYNDYEGDKILVARVGANAGTVNKVTGKYCVSDNTLMITLSDTINLNYIYFKLIEFQLSSLVFGSGQPLITGGHLKQIEIPLPPLETQIEIAQILTDMDLEIVGLAGKLLKYRAIKTGMMQNLLSGKIRLV